MCLPCDGRWAMGDGRWAMGEDMIILEVWNSDLKSELPRYEENEVVNEKT